MNDKLELDIPVLLPDLPDAADACLDRLVSTLSKREGVERAHVICLDGNTPAALCIHFDAAKLPLPRLREMVRAAGAEITERYGHAIWQVTGINHERRARTVSDALCALPGVAFTASENAACPVAILLGSILLDAVCACSPIHPAVSANVAALNTESLFMKTILSLLRLR